MRIRLLMIVAAYLAISDAGAQHLDAKFVDELCIGCDETKPLEYLLQSPGQVVVDEEGRIYVSERRLYEIRIFDANGIHLKTLGGEGQGPGQFSEISSMMIDRDGSLMVMDWGNQRVTRFRGLDETAETAPWPGKSGARASASFPLTDDYLFLYHWGEEGSPRDGRLFHVHHTDLSGIKGSFGDTRLLYDLSRPIERAASRGMAGGEWSAALDSDARVYLAKGMYDGTLYRFTQEDDDVWRVDRLRGHAAVHPPYEEMDIATFERERPLNAFATYNSEGRFAGKIYNRSTGLHSLQDGGILHFSMVPPNGDRASDERQLMVERFDGRGRLIGWGTFDPETHGDYVKVAARDGHGRFYLVEWTRDQGPTVRRVRLDIKPAAR